MLSKKQKLSVPQFIIKKVKLHEFVSEVNVKEDNKKMWCKKPVEPKSIKQLKSGIREVENA